MIYTFIKSVYKKLSTNIVFGGGNESLKMPIEKQKQFLNRIPEPKDDYDRSYYKYKCFCEYCYYHKKWILILFNIGAAIVAPFIKLRLNRIPHIQKQIVDAVYENVPRLPNTDIIPDIIRKSYHNSIDITQINYEGVFLDHEAKAICQELKHRYFFSFYYRLIVMLKLAQFSVYLTKYQPKTILFYSCEREFAGPLQTLLCEKNGAKYEAYMHGDYLYALCFAFQRYSMYYTWDEWYNEMFKSLRCSSPMTVYTPIKLTGIAKKLNDKECRYFATYYFSDESRKSAETICKVFDSFKLRNLRCKIRPHPRFSDISMLKSVFKDYEIENLQEYSLSYSIETTLYVIGLNTTVLSQAFFSGKTVVIDDLSSPDLYSDLNAKGYIMMHRPHILLSSLIETVENDFQYDDNYAFVDA